MFNNSKFMMRIFLSSHKKKILWMRHKKMIFFSVVPRRREKPEAKLCRSKLQKQNKKELRLLQQFFLNFIWVCPESKIFPFFSFFFLFFYTHPIPQKKTSTFLWGWKYKKTKKNLSVARFGSRGASKILWVSETRTSIAHANVSRLELANECNAW